MLTKRLMIVAILLTVTLSDIFSQAADTSIYQIKIRNISGDSISMNDFRNSKILIAVFDGSDPDITFLQQLKSVQNTSDSLTIVAVPGRDFGTSVNLAQIISLKDSLGINYIIGEPSNVKKENENQHVLFEWLTHDTANSHFNYDIENPNQMFIVSENGVLFGLMGSGTSYTDILSLVNRQIN